jgi:hypothetical protein
MKQSLYNIILRIFCCVLLATELQAQSPAIQQFEDLEALKKKGFFKTYFTGLIKDFTNGGKPFDYSGGLGIGLRSYSALGTTDRQDPFLYNINGNFNARVFQLSLPFSFAIAAKNTESAYPNARELVNSFRNSIDAQRQRFVRLGISPRYKWITTHFGHRSMSMSQYTMRDLVFLGAGTELTPGKFRFAAMYGQLAKAEPIDLSLVQPNLPRFERTGWAVKTGYGTQEDYIEAVIFQAHDAQNSVFVPDSIPDQISPESNQAVGLVAQKRFAKKFRLKIDLGASALSPNMLDAPSESRFPHPAFLYQAHNTTDYKTALEGLFDYQAKYYMLGFKYRRIEPGYKTHGAYFFNSDIEEWTVNLGFNLFKNALTFTGNGGIQRNNLDGTKTNRLTNRVVGAMNANYTKNRFNFGANYSNNASDVAYLLNPNDPILNVIIIAQDAGANATYTIADSSRQQVFNLTANAQIVTDDVADPTASAFSRMYMGNFVYSLGLPKTGWTYTGRLNYNQNQLTSQLLDRYGIGGGLNKSFLKNKLTTGFDLNYFYTVIQGLANTGNLTSGINVNWNVNDAQSIGLNWTILSTNNTTIAGSNRFGEVIGTVNYQYNFHMKPRQKNKEARATYK